MATRQRDLTFSGQMGRLGYRAPVGFRTFFTLHATHCFRYPRFQVGNAVTIASFLLDVKLIRKASGPTRSLPPDPGNDATTHFFLIGCFTCPWAWAANKLCTSGSTIGNAFTLCCSRVLCQPRPACTRYPSQLSSLLRLQRPSYWPPGKGKTVARPREQRWPNGRTGSFTNDWSDQLDRKIQEIILEARFPPPP